MRLEIIVSGAMILMACSLIGCDDLGVVEESVDVVVKTSTKDYDATSFKQLFPEKISQQAIASAFGTNYSDERRILLLQRMLMRVAALGEEGRFLDSVVTRHGCREVGGYILPTYAERARFNGRDAWLVQFVYGLGVPSFSHYSCYAYSVPDLEQLYFLGCR